MQATSAALRCTSTCPPPLAAGPAAAAATRRLAAVAAATHSRGQRSVAVAARRQQEQQQAPPPPPPPVPDVDEPRDPWEGEQWELVGQVASVFVPLLAVLAVAIGLFASQTYNEGATVFMDSPKGPEDTIKLIPAEQMQQP